MPETEVSREAVQSVYTERNAVVMAFVLFAMTQGWKGGVKFFDEDPMWPVILIDTPKGQCSWHVPMETVPSTMPLYEGEWDGHTTEEKYQRLTELVETLTK
jgi:hypothetical protein